MLSPFVEETRKLYQDFDFVEGYMPSSSSSKTEFWKVKNRNDHKYYMLKMYVNVYKGEHTKPYVRQKHEIKTYITLRNHLIEQENVRNILYCYKSGTENFRDLVKFVYESPYREKKLTKKMIEYNLVEITKYLIRNIDDRMTKIDTIHMNEPHQINYYNWNPKQFVFSYFITQYVERSVDFGSFLKKTKELNIKTICDYFSIICTTLFQMAQLGVNQNDLHFGNILINTSHTVYGPDKYFKRVYLLVFNNKTFIIDNSFTPLIYDFDRAAIYGKHLEFLTGYEFGGNCPDYHEKRDFIRVICCMYQYLKEKSENQYQKFAEDILKHLVPNVNFQIRLESEQYWDTLSQKWRRNKSCHLSINNSSDSIQCQDDMHKLIVSNQEVLSYFFKNSSFESVPTTSILQNNKKVIQQVIKRLDYWKISQIDNPDEQYLYIHKNVQFVGKFSTKQQDTFIHNILNNIRS